jgi:ABC-type nitrate/sulfonate/bicarbonate transport system substrate-binding protein
VLADATGLVDDSVFYVSTRPAAEKHGRVLEAAIEEIGETDQWMQAHPGDPARQPAEATGLPLNIWQTSISQHNYGIKAVDQKVIDAQQSIADAFRRNEAASKGPRIKSKEKTSSRTQIGRRSHAGSLLRCWTVPVVRIQFASEISSSCG